MSETVKAIRVRLVGRRWKAGFIADLASGIINLFGNDMLVRINSFIAQRSGMPITDIDIFSGDEERVKEVRRLVEELLEKHRYPYGRLLTVKIVEVRITAGEASREQAPASG